MEKLRNVLLTAGGILYLFFGAFHLTFFKAFSASNPSFNQIVPALSKIMVMLNVGIVVFFVSLGVIILMFRRDIISTRLGRALLLMSAGFFFIRGIAEFAFPTFKIAFVITMLVVSVVFLIPALSYKKDS